MQPSKVTHGHIKIQVEKVIVEGSGAIILTGPSSCGKGEIANELRRFLDLPERKHLSMGDILRLTIKRAREDHRFKSVLTDVYHIRDDVSIFDDNYNAYEMIEKASKYSQELKQLYGNDHEVTQLDWLEYCVSNGLLIPDEWTVNIINATFETSPELQSDIFILDGYPRTVKAAEELINTFTRLEIPIIMVIHLSITKDEMIKRATGRNRMDDQLESLERRYQFYVENVQPSIDYLKTSLGSSRVALIDAHQPVYDAGGCFNLPSSIQSVTSDVLNALGLPKFLLGIED